MLKEQEVLDSEERGLMEKIGDPSLLKTGWLIVKNDLTGLVTVGVSYSLRSYLVFDFLIYSFVYWVNCI